MEFKELTNKSEAELQKMLAETRDELRELKFKDASHQLKDVRQVREAKKKIATILTALNTKK
jgi:ribosomal protein L29